MRTPESYEKDEICKYLKSLGAWYFRPYMAGFGKAGVPDIVACIHGRFWGIEVKRPGKVLTRLQTLRLEEIERAYGKVAWGTAAQVITIIRDWAETRD
jgi:hypothetical protein